MQEDIKKLKKYALLSFIIPIFALNACLLLYKLLGNIDNYPQYNWDKKRVEYSFKEYIDLEKNYKSFTFTNCPKYNYQVYFTSTKSNQEIRDNRTNRDLIDDLIKENKIKTKVIYSEKIKNKSCLKNYPIAYFIIKNFSVLEDILLVAREENSSGFPKIINPYFYGEVSISRTARYFPATYIFKPFIILSAIFLFLYWKSNLNIFNQLKNKKNLEKFSNYYFYFGILSCTFLILHASFLGMDIDSKLFGKIRKLIIILFIFFEVAAQASLTTNLFKFRELLKQNINLLVLKIKITFIIIVFILTLISLAILSFGDPSSEFKYILEWNYFSLLLLYYFLSRLLWKKK